MKEAAYLLVDAREQVCQALRRLEQEMDCHISGAYPKGRPGYPLVVWSEYSNISTDCPVVDEVVFQTELWSEDRESLLKLAQAVNRVMLGLGLRRIYSSPDSCRDQGRGGWRKIFRFGRRIDKRMMRMID